VPYQSLISGDIRPVASRPLLSQTRLVQEPVQIVVWAELSLFSASIDRTSFMVMPARANLESYHA